MAKTFTLCVLCVLEGPRCKRGTGREEKPLKALSLAEAAESAEKDEIEYLHQNRRKICSDETTHPSGKVVR